MQAWESGEGGGPVLKGGYAPAPQAGSRRHPDSHHQAFYASKKSSDSEAAFNRSFLIRVRIARSPPPVTRMTQTYTQILAPVYASVLVSMHA